LDDENTSHIRVLLAAWLICRAIWMAVMTGLVPDSEKSSKQGGTSPLMMQLQS